MFSLTIDEFREIISSRLELTDWAGRNGSRNVELLHCERPNDAHVLVTWHFVFVYTGRNEKASDVDPREVVDCPEPLASLLAVRERNWVLQTL